MKTLIKLIVVAFAAISMNAFATSALESLSVETIKQTMTTEQIEVALDKWKSEKLADIRWQAPLISERAPAEAKTDMLKAQVEREYNQMVKDLGL